VKWKGLKDLRGQSKMSDRQISVYQTVAQAGFEGVSNISVPQGLTRVGISPRQQQRHGYTGKARK
jgi:hypothetical protein